MELCSENHDEVCFSARNCPVCLEIDARKDLESTVESLELDIQTLKDAQS